MCIKYVIGGNRKKFKQKKNLEQGNKYFLNSDNQLNSRGYDEKAVSIR
jgi:hypothetical protein